jgi:hypothetical protein
MKVAHYMQTHYFVTTHWMEGVADGGLRTQLHRRDPATLLVGARGTSDLVRVKEDPCNVLTSTFPAQGIDRPSITAWFGRLLDLRLTSR